MTFDQMRRGGYVLDLTCWRCRHRVRIQPNEFDRLIGKKGWQEDIYEFVRRAVCAACKEDGVVARGPKIKTTWPLKG